MQLEAPLQRSRTPFEDHERTMRGYDSAMRLVKQLSVEYGLTARAEVPRVDPPTSRRDWPLVEFDQRRNRWVCTSHRDTVCRECPGALELLNARNKGRA